MKTYELWLQYIKVYGNDFTFFILNKPYIIVTDPKTVKAILSDSKNFIKGDDYTVKFKLCFGNGLVTSNGEKHKKDRTFFNKFFTHSNINQYTNTIHHKTFEIFDLLPQNGTVNIEQVMAILTFRIFMNFFTNGQYQNDLDEEKIITHAVSEGSYYVSQLINYNLPPSSLVPSVRKLKKYTQELGTRLLSKVSNTPCLNAMHNAEMTHEDIFYHFVTFVSAGHDTTTYFLSYTLYLLATHPDVQNELRKEIQEVTGDSDDISIEHMKKMHYLNMVMHESLRMYTVIPTLTRLCVQEKYLPESNIHIPAQTNICIPFYVINHNSQIWPEPYSFNPENFRDFKNHYIWSDKGFFPFNYGSRSCIGMNLAHLEASIILCILLKHFHFSATTGFTPQIRSGISLTTHNGIYVDITKKYI
jgi:cytochrome P450